MKDLKRMYLQALDELEAAYEELYIRMLEDGEVSPLTQYKFNRYQKLEREFVEQLKELGQEEVRMLEDLAISAYVAVATETSGVLNYVFEPLQLHQMAQKAFEMNWKGSNFSSRIWNNKNKLLMRLKKMVTDAIALGKSKDETVKDFMKVFNASFSDADRLVRTELMNIINQAQKDIYTQRGYRKYTLLPHYDSRTSEICKSLNTSKEYEFDKAITGENYPPLHPRCRTIAIPVIEFKERNDIIKISDHKLPFQSNPDAIYDLLDEGNQILQRRYYGRDGFPILDIDNYNHGNAKIHPVVPHAHDWIGKKREKRWRELTQHEKEMNSDLFEEE